MQRIIGFEPIVFPDSKVLILGSMPGVQSLEQQFYYANKTNRFWPLIGELVHQPTTTKEQRIEALRAGRIALWDVCHSCIRKGSMDTAIKEAVPNDIPAFLKANPGIQTVLCNGRTSRNMLRKYYPDIEAKSCLPHRQPMRNIAWMI